MPVYRGSQQPTGQPAGVAFPNSGFPMRSRSLFDRPAISSADALGLGPPPPPNSGRLAIRLGLGLFGTLATIIWMWGMAPPPV